MDSRFSDFIISRFPEFQRYRFPAPQIFKFPDAAGTAGQNLRSQPEPSPNVPRDQIRCKEPGALAAINENQKCISGPSKDMLS